MQEVGYDEIVIDQDGELQTDKKFNKIFELIEPETTKNSFKHLIEDGIICSTGQLGNQWYLDKFDPIVDIAANSYLTSFYSGNVNEEKIERMLDYVKKYDVDAKPERVFDLKHVADAHRYLENLKSFGKVVVVED